MVTAVGVRLVASVEVSTQPTLTIAIPHFRNPLHLRAVVDSLLEQRSDDFEVLISDDASPDDASETIPLVLRDSGISFRYFRQSTNLGYDRNLRFCLDNAAGEYVLILGNDDALVGPQTVDEIVQALDHVDCAVAFTNFVDYFDETAITKRALETGVLGSGPDVAVRFFRSFSFVAGLIFRQDVAEAHSTARWDGSIYYQVYLACRIVAAGHDLAALDVLAVRKDVRIEGAKAPNYASRARLAPPSFEARHLGLDSFIRVTIDAIEPHLGASRRNKAVRRIFLQMYLITYPYWLFEYRRVGRWSHSFGVFRSALPYRLAKESGLSGLDLLSVNSAYWLATAAGLVIPRSLFSRLEGWLADSVRAALLRPWRIRHPP